MASAAQMPWLPAGEIGPDAAVVREGAMGVPVPGDGLGGAAGPGGADQAAECPWLTGLTEGAFAGQAAGDGEFAAPGPPGDRRPGSATTPRSPPETPTRRAPQARQPVALPERKRHLRRSCPRSQPEPRGQPKLLAPTRRMRLTKASQDARRGRAQDRATEESEMLTEPCRSAFMQFGRWIVIWRGR